MSAPGGCLHLRNKVEMKLALANAICAFGMAWLLYLDREKAERVSYALWIPGLWIGISASRPVSLWFGFQGGGNLGLDGSPVDAAVFGILLVLGIGVLMRRSSRTRTLLAANGPIVIYFLFCFVSIVWSTHADVSFKRWTKAIGDLVMALIIATDTSPVAAFRRLVSRLGMVLFPISVLFIYYYGELGRGYTEDGLQMNTGVTTSKNCLGLIVLVISLAVFWNVRWLYVHKEEPNRNRRLVAQGTLLAFGLALFRLADSSTCKACFVLGTLLIFILNRNAFRRRPARVHALCLATLLIGGASLLFGGQGVVAGALSRGSNLSGRTEIWEAVIPAASNPIVGDGFESFWNSKGADQARQTLVNEGFSAFVISGLQEAHNGYIEIYLQLGWIGVCLIAFVIISGYKRALSAYRREPELGSLFLAYVASGTIYGITEAGFRTMCPNLIFLLMTIVSATAVTAGFFGPENSITTLGPGEIIPELKSIHTAWEELTPL
jgi:exopolysaccharide production protein ExoQ